MPITAPVLNPALKFEDELIISETLEKYITLSGVTLVKMNTQNGKNIKSVIPNIMLIKDIEFLS